MFGKNEIILENAIVRLIPLDISHVDTLLPIALEADLWKWTTQQITDRKSLLAYLELVLKEKAEGKAYPFLIIDKKREEVAGCTRYYDIQPGHKTLEIGYTWIGKSYQGKGVNKACKYELLYYAFNVLRYNRVALRTDYLNHQSRNAITKIGAKQEGILRSHSITYSGRVRDTVYFSIIASEWDIIRKTIFEAFV